MPAARGSSKKIPYLDLTAREVLSLALPALGIGILLGSMGAARGQSLFGTSLLVPLARIVCVAVSVAFAFLFRNGVAKKPVLLTGAAALAVIQLGAALLAFAFGESERFALGVISTIAEGTSLSLIVFLLLASLLNRSPKEIAVAVSLGFVLLNVYDCFFIGASDEACAAQWLVGKMVALGIAGLVVVRGRSLVVPETKDAAVHKAETEHGDAASHASTQPHSQFPFAEIVPFAGLIAILFLIQGAYSYITGVGGVGSNALFDMTVGIYVVGVRILVFGFCLIVKKELAPVPVAATGALLWVFGLLLTTLLWNTDIRFMGALALNSGLYIMQPLILILAVQLARRNGEQAVPIIFSMIALEYANHITRLTALFFVADPTTVQFDGISFMSVVSLSIVAASAMLFLLVSRRRPSIEPSASSGAVFSNALAFSAGDLSSPLLQKEIEQFNCFSRLSQDKQLTQREEEVLYEAMHGYSIDHIAERLCISRQTVKTYLSRAYNRLGVGSKQEALKLLDSYRSL